MAVTPDGARVYVANNVDGTVSVIDTATDTVVGRPLSVGAGPDGVAVAPGGTRVYVANRDSGSVSVIAIEVPPTITGSVPAGVVGQGYSHTVTVTGFPTPAVSVTAGTPPPGLTVTPAGTLSGTPAAAGEYSFTLTADNGVAPAASLPVTVPITGPGCRGSRCIFGS
ncbi:hypothetical protein R3Q06_32665 [Rhodococcus erythropolis]|uniref:YncE family protein n=1 Tax=Rhodococcus erythropolis TaxID=1833 RepID=UPI0029499EC8|nr:hypothetical protein [Rhodococcus erythropolis]MDV6278220.1 hypothetical protein [Rhodococcus erythropolis]